MCSGSEALTCERCAFWERDVERGEGEGRGVCGALDERRAEVDRLKLYRKMLLDCKIVPRRAFKTFLRVRLGAASSLGGSWPDLGWTSDGQRSIAC